VSVTGGECALHCNHCDGHYLQHMVPVGAARPVLESREYSSILLSGGADREGRLPLIEQLPFIEWVRRQGIRINAHVGLQSDEDVRVLAPLFDRVSLDYVWDEETIRAVYHLNRTGSDYLHAAESWADAFSMGSDTGTRTLGRRRVNLHLTIGLKGGAVAGEFAAIDSLVTFDPVSLVFLVLIPTEGTVYGNVPIVPVEAVESVFSYARRTLPSTDLVLGCMHPRAAGYGDQLVQLARQYGFRGVVGETMSETESEQLEECCVFYQ
jgi:lipoyl synthase